MRSPTWSKQGYVRHIGLSEVGADTLRRAATVHPICDLQIEYSLISRGIEEEILPTARELGIGVTAYGVLSRGLLSGHWSADRQARDFRAHLPRFTGENLERNLALVEALRVIAETKGTTVAQVAIAWVLSRGGDVVPLVGARRRDRLAESLGAARARSERRGPGRDRGRRPRRRRRRHALRRRADGVPGQRTVVTADSGVLTADAILLAAEDVLRRFGPAKTTVVDVAKALGVSHGSVYRHFPSKAALRDAVAERWLARVASPLEEIVAGPGAAVERLGRWLDSLASTKQRMAREDAELFATFRQLTEEAREVVAAHVDHLAGQAARIVADGVASGELAATDPAVTGRAVFQATARFHHPAHADEWGDPALGSDLAAVWALLVAGLLPR